jgi:hypothetical protein
MNDKPNIRTKTKKALKENIGVNHHDIELGNYFLDMTSKNTTSGRKQNWTSPKLRTFVFQRT